MPLTSIPTLASALLADDAGSMHHVHNFLASLAVKSSMAASLLSPFDQVPTWAATPQRRRRRRTNTADSGEAGNHKKTTSQKSTKRKVADDGGDDEAHPDTTPTTTTHSSTTGQPRKHRRVQRDETHTTKGRRRRSATTTTATTTAASKRGSQATSIAFLLNDASTDCALDDRTFLFDYAASPSSSQASSPTPSPIEPAALSQPSDYPPIRPALLAAPPGGFPFPCHFVLG